MERDFLGLSSKEPLAVVKEEVNTDGFKEIGFSKGPGIQWPFSSEVSAFPHLMSFKVNQDDNTKKIGTDSLVSSGFMPISSIDPNDPNKKRCKAEIQKSFNHDRQGGTQFSLTAYSVQPEVHAVHRSYDVKMFPVSNQAISVSMGNNFFKNHSTTSGQNLAGTNVKPQLLGGIPVTAPHPILPTIGSVGGVTEPWTSVKASGLAQLTIFYAGTVNVYDNISPEKAQAIMLLAGNGSSMASMAHPKVQVQSSKPVAGDGVPVNQSTSTPPSAGLSSPLSVSSHTGAQSGSGSTSADDIMAAKANGVTTNFVSKLESPKMVNAVGSATTMIPSVPQARKASLAWFLEKRKERVMNAAPYSLGKKSPEYTTGESNGVNYSVTSAAGTSSLSAIKEGNLDL